MALGDLFLASETFTVREDDPEGVVRITIARTGDATLEAVLTLGVTAGSATAGSDYAAPAFQTVVVPVGADSVTVEIPILDDDLAEATESFFVSLVLAQNARLLAPRTAEVRILDDERIVVAPPFPPLTSDFIVAEQTVVSGLSTPIRFEFSPSNPDLVYIVLKGGEVDVYDLSTREKVSDLLDIRAKTNDFLDRGLMDIALHPDLENNPYLYAFYVVDPPETAGLDGNAGRDGGGNRFSYVSRFTLDAASGHTRIVPGSEVVIVGGGATSINDISGLGALDYTDPAFSDPVAYPASDILDMSNPADPVFKKNVLKVDSLTHAGGALAFGPDGSLYVSVGDGASPNYADPRGVYVQDHDSYAGKILRIDPITGDGLADNPFASGPDLTDNRDKIWQSGLRNPFSMGFDASGQLFITDTGWFTWEEINSGAPGANFGWPYFEGGEVALVRTPGYQSLASAEGFYAAVEAGLVTITGAFRAFAHAEEEPGFSLRGIVGGDAFIGRDGPYPESLRNHYIFADVGQGEVYSIDANDRTDIRFLYETSRFFAPVHFGTGPDGHVYYADLIGGNFGRLSIRDSLSASAFGGNVYLPGTPGLTWSEAQAEAQRLGGRLVEIDSEAENAFVTATFGGSAPIWLGISDAAVEGRWDRGSGGTADYFNWLPGEPNDNFNEDYAVLASADGRWGDQPAAGGGFFSGGVWRGGLATLSVIEFAPDPAGRFTFGDSVYQLGAAGLSWTEAQAEAQRLGGRLVEIDSEAENDFVTRAFGGAAPIWVGISDAATEGLFLTGSGAAATFTNWIPGEPNASGDQDYVVIATPDGLWDDQAVEGGGFLSGGVWRGGFPTLSVIEFARTPSERIAFGDSFYQLGAPGLTWSEAQAEAQRLGGRLVEIDSVAENAFVTATFGGSAPIWLGVSDAALEGRWDRGSGGNADYFNWLPGEPNDNFNQDYAVLASADGRWDDQPATGGGFFSGGVWQGGHATLSVIEFAPGPAPRIAFGDSFYQFGAAGLTWSEAQAEAQRLGGRLVEIDSEAENAFVTATFGGSAPIWLGISDAALEGRWDRGSGGTADYFNWLPGEPNDNFNQDYAVLASADGRWDDQPATGGGFFSDGDWRGGLATLSVIEFDVA